MNIQKSEKWLRWLSQIVFEVENLFKDSVFYYEIESIVKKNYNLSENNPFIGWMKHNYIENAAIAIGRLRDNHKDAISLYKLLNELKESPELIVSKEKKVAFSQRTQWDIEYLEEKSMKIKAYRDNIGAHSGTRKFTDWFCELEMNDCINCIVELTEKYYAIIQKKNMLYRTFKLKIHGEKYSNDLG